MFRMLSDIENVYCIFYVLLIDSVILVVIEFTRSTYVITWRYMKNNKTTRETQTFFHKEIL